MKSKKYKGVKPSEYFKEFKEGDKVALAENLAHQVNIPKTFLGRTGVVLRKIKGAYEVKFLNGKTYKNLIIRPVHLKKIG
jgi:ribosomal protein L21E